MSSAVAGPRFAPQRVDVERRADGSTLLRSRTRFVHSHAPSASGSCNGHRARLSAASWRNAPGDDWRRVTYAEAIDAVRRIGASLLARGLTAATPVAVL